MSLRSPFPIPYGWFQVAWPGDVKVGQVVPLQYFGRHLALWRDYHGGIESDIADIVNTGRGAMAGAINAAIFLEDFVPADLPWLHVDLFAWNDGARPGRPVGGEAQTIRTLLAWLERRFG